MDLLTGKVTKLSYSTEVSGGEHGASTSHVATLQVDSRPVRLTMPESIAISEGDNIVVAGITKRGVLNAFAYRNLSNGALGKGSVVTYYIFGAIFTAIGLALLMAFIGIPFLATGVWALIHAKRLSQAYSMVEYTAHSNQNFR